MLYCICEVITMSITAKQLAAMLGLSESAVSLALNNKPGVSRATRERVFEAAKENGFEFFRKSFTTDQKKGVICFTIYKKSGAVVDDTPFFSALTDGVSICCLKEGYDCVIRYLYEDDDLENQIYAIEKSHFSGIIVLATEMVEERLKVFDLLTSPIVFLDSYFEKPQYNFILINNIQGAFMATSHLIKRRRTQPGYLRSSFWISNFEQRADGFYKAIRAAGMSTSQSHVIRLTPSQSGAYHDMKTLLNSGEKLADCYFADNDLIAIGAMQALKEAGYRIPEDVAIVGFDDMPSCEYVNPPLSTINVPKVCLGETATLRLIQLINGLNPQPLKIEVSTNLVKRKSVT